LADKDHLPDWNETDLFIATLIKSPRDRGADPVADNKFLFKNLMFGLKNIFHQLKVCKIGSPIDPPNASAYLQEVSYGFNAEEVQVLIKLFHEGAYVFRYYEMNKPGTKSHYTNALELVADHYISSTEEEKDLL
jgi:transformation/transcription domain-associated protein